MIVQENGNDTPLFRALLVPYRSLGRNGFFVLMGLLLLAWFMVSIVFMKIGAWPVFGFFGLDILALYLAFRINYRAAQVREEISLSRTELLIRKVSRSGKLDEYRVNPFWARFNVSRHSEIGVTNMVVESRGSQISIGSFLNPAEREKFALAFGRALSIAKA